MTDWTFNRILYSASLFAIIISTISLVVIFVSQDNADATRPAYRVPDIRQVCSLPEGINLLGWRMILIHHSGEAGSTIESLRGYYTDLRARIPYHFIIRSDGAILPTAAWKKQEFCKQTEDDEYNRQSIGICVMGNFSLPESVPSPEQMTSLTALTKYLMKETSIPGRYVWQRSEMSDQKDSPGKNFPWSQFLRSLK